MLSVSNKARLTRIAIFAATCTLLVVALSCTPSGGGLKTEPSGSGQEFVSDPPDTAKPVGDSEFTGDSGVDSLEDFFQWVESNRLKSLKAQDSAEVAELLGERPSDYQTKQGMLGWIAIKELTSSPGEAGGADDVHETVTNGLPMLLNCYEKRLKKDNSVRGIVSLRILTNKTGRVKSAKITQDALAVGSCITSRIRSWQFRRIELPGAVSDTLELTLVFGRILSRLKPQPWSD